MKRYIVGKKVGKSKGSIIKELSRHRKKAAACKRLCAYGPEYDRKVEVYRVSKGNITARLVICSCNGPGEWRGKRRRLK